MRAAEERPQANRGREPVKSWHHSSLSVTDVDRAAAFYGQAFGFETVFEARDMTREIADITGIRDLRCDLVQMRAPVGDHVLELIAFTGEAVPPAGAPEAPVRPGAGHICFVVDDLEAALARAQRLGARLLGRVTAFEEGRAAYLIEPAGSVFELEQLAPEDESAP